MVIAMTLAMRNRWVIPEGTDCSVLVGSLVSKAQKRRTVSVVVQVGELVTPLGDDAQGILEEGDDDEESANRRDITATQTSVECNSKRAGNCKNSRLDGMRQGVEPVFNLAGLFANSIQRTGIIGGVWSSGISKRGLRAQVVSCRPSDLSHGGRGKMV